VREIAGYCLTADPNGPPQAAQAKQFVARMRSRGRLWFHFDIAISLGQPARKLFRAGANWLA